MSLHAALYTALTGDAGVSALVSTRVYPSHAVQGAALPHIVYRVIDGGTVQHSTAATPLVEGGFEVECYAESMPDAEAVSAAVTALLDGHSGSLGTGALDVRRIARESHSDAFVPPTDGSDVGRYAVQLNFDCWYNHT